MTEPLQFSIDWDAKLPVSAQIGMERCDSHANVLWKRWTDGAIQAVARRLEYFTVDDVLSELEAMPNPPDTHNLAALGPRMKEVAKVLGYMEATNEVKRSKRPEKHGNLMRVWKSKLYRSHAVATADTLYEMPHEANGEK
jgi:hypothetical protein